MTKRFFEDWKNKQSLTDHISVNINAIEEKGKTYQFYPFHFDLSTLVFGKNHITVKTKCAVYSPFYEGEVYKVIKIHRKHIHTVYFKSIK